MGWKLYSPPDREELIEFLSKDEWGHVAFSSRLKETKESSTPQWIYIRRENSPGARITEAVLYTQEGLLIPVFSRSAAPFRPELEQVLFQKKPRKKLNTVMGLRNDVEVIQRLVKPARRAEVTYHVMILQEIGRASCRERV